MRLAAQRKRVLAMPLLLNLRMSLLPKNFLLFQMYFAQGTMKIIFAAPPMLQLCTISQITWQLKNFLMVSTNSSKNVASASNSIQCAQEAFNHEDKKLAQITSKYSSSETKGLIPSKRRYRLSSMTPMMRAPLETFLGLQEPTLYHNYQKTIVRSK